MKNDPYKKAGVDIKAGNDLVDKIRKDVASTFDKNVLGGIGSFSGFYSLPKGFKNPVLVACTDGCLLYTSPSPRDLTASRMPSSA